MYLFNSELYLNGTLSVASVLVNIFMETIMKMREDIEHD